MPAAVDTPGMQGAQVQQGPASVPFIVGSNLYEEPPFSTVVQLMDGNSHETVLNITPGNFLRGVVLDVVGAGGVIGTGVLSGDGPFSAISSLSLEDISGGPILFPMSGFAAMVKQKYLQPWEGDPAKRPGFSNTINPAFRLRVSVELRDTLALLANTDARAQYRFRFTIAPFNPGVVTTTGTATAPTLTVKTWIQAWAQPDAVDLLGNPIEQIPPGLNASRFVMHEFPVLNAGATIVRHSLVGNEVRGVAWIVRNSLGARVDLTDANCGPVDFRLDNRRLWKSTPSQIIEKMNWFYDDVQNATQSRETGVFVIPRFRNPGRQVGEYWLQTVEQTLLQAEMNGADLGANAPGTVELLYDELAIAGNLPPELEGI